MSFDGIAELQRKNTSLTRRVSNSEQEKSKEVVDIRMDSEKTSEKRYLCKQIALKDDIIAEEQSRVQSLADTKCETCSKLDEKIRELHVEKSRVRDLNLRLFETGKELLLLRESNAVYTEKIEAVVRNAEQLKDHLRSRSKAPTQLEQELGATKVSVNYLKG